MDNRVPQAGEGDELALRPIDRLVMDMASDRARQDPRQRFLLRYHEFSDRVQRIVNALEPESYARPHRHVDPPRVELFVLLRGRGAVVRFDDEGNIVESAIVAAGGPVHGAEVPPGAWHSIMALERGTVFFEIKEGPYDAATDKQFATWAPSEEDPPAAAYLSDLRARLGLLSLAHLADAEMDAALDDDLP